jgi:ubiquinone/menaquinone biosynthesis C-methylase UbiE
MKSLCDKNNLRQFYYNEPNKLQVRLDAWKKFGTNKTGYFHWLSSKLIVLRHKGASFLDVGCGTGLLLKAAGKRYKDINIFGLDLSEAMVREAKAQIREFEHCKVILGNAEKLPFINNSFEAVSATHMLYHVPNINKAVAEMKRVLKPSGIVFLTTSDYQLDKGLNRIHYLALDKLGFPKFMKNKSSYLRFTPDYALTLIKKHFSEVRVFHYRNDSVYRDVSPCFDPSPKYKNDNASSIICLLPISI